VISATADELQAHAAMLAIISKASGGKCLWPVAPPPPVAPEINYSSA
jgi:hypothetical protein